MRFTCGFREKVLCKTGQARANFSNSARGRTGEKNISPKKPNLTMRKIRGSGGGRDNELQEKQVKSMGKLERERGRVLTKKVSGRKEYR